MRKISIILSFVLLIGCFPFSSSAVAETDAAQIISESERGLLNALDISVSAGNTVTRGDFAVYLAKIAGTAVFIDKNAENAFSDLGKSEKTAFINAVCASGLMNGIGGGLFAPNEAISGVDAVVALVRLIGFKNLANRYGGYPEGYLMAANLKNVTKGVAPTSGALDSRTLEKLLANTLFSPVNQVTSIDSDKVLYTEASADDVLKIYHGITKVKGVVTANRFTSLTADTTSCGEDEIEIEKNVYQYADKSLENYIGMNVTAYLREEADNTHDMIIAMAPHEKNNQILSVDSEDIVQIVGRELQYDDEGRIGKASVKRGFSLIYNGKLDPEGVTSDLDCDDAKLTLIDNDMDGVYDVVLVNQAQTMVITSIHRTEYVIYGEGGACVDYDDSKKGSSFEIRNEKGEDVYFDRLKNGNVITAFVSRDSQCVKIYLSSTTVNGTITEVNNQDGVVKLLLGKEEAEYKIAPGYESKLVLGLEGQFYLDYYGRLVYSDAEAGADYSYGYLMGGMFKTSMSSATLRIFTDVGIEDFACGDALMIDGRKKQAIEKDSSNAIYQNGAFVPQVIRYKQNAAGQLISIDTVMSGSGDKQHDKLELSKTVDAVYNQKASNFGNACVFGSGTFFAKIPTDPALILNEEYYSNDQSFLSDEKKYTVTAYDMDDTLTAGAIVYQSNTLGAMTKLDDYSSLGVIQKKTRIADDQGEARDAVRIFNCKNKKEEIYYFDEKYNVSRDMEFGDIILFVADPKSNIVSWAYDYDVSAGDVAGNVSGYNSYFTKYVGYPYAKNDSSFSFLSVKDNPTLEESWSHLYSFPIKGMNYIEVDMTKSAICESSYDYVESYKHFKNTANKAFVKVYRGGGVYTSDVLVMYKY